ncbi:MAG TPA: CYTH domain-containing protein [Candidatus Binatia bacterium]|nr:CYTH domain-containing protein [Candidatus Binatia bacterium]
MPSPLEREIKLSAPPDYALPDLADLATGGVADSGDEPLESVYWDTDGLELARHGVGLRHRVRRDRPGDVGVWTLKSGGHREGDLMVRGEHEVPASGSAIPPELLAEVPAEIGPAAIHPVAVLRARRRVLTLTAADGGSVQVMDDTVDIISPVGAVAERFRELEVELREGGEQLAGRVAARLREAGAGPPQSSSKYGRALRALGYQVGPIADL